MEFLLTSNFFDMFVLEQNLFSWGRGEEDKHRL